jgi:hypothetical protein
MTLHFGIKRFQIKRKEENSGHGPHKEPNTKTDWPIDCWPYFNLNHQRKFYEEVG